MLILQKRLSEPLRNFCPQEPPHNDQRGFFESKAKVQFALGGNRPLAYGTKVRMADGTVAAIEDIQIGDRVLAYQDNRCIPTAVIDIPYDGLDDTITAVTNSGLTVTSTPDHCFPIDCGGPVTPQKLTMAEATRTGLTGQCFVLCDDKAAPDGSAIKHSFESGVQRCRCITVENPSHTFVLANGIVTHNSGKTHIGAVKAITLCLGTHPTISTTPPVYGRACAPKYEDGCKGVILKKLKQLIPERLLWKQDWTKAWAEKAKTLTFNNHSQINLKSYEQDINSYGGDDLDFVWSDEHGPENYFLENFARLTDRNGIYFSTMTPELGMSWEQDYIQNPPVLPGIGPLDIAHFTFWTENNPHLSDEGVAMFAANIRDERLKRAKLYGEFVPLQGLVIPQFNRSKHIIPDRRIDPAAFRVFCIDTHIQTPSAALWGAWEPQTKQLVVYRTYKGKHSIPEWKQIIRSKSAHDGKIHLWLGDESESEKTDQNIYGQDSILTQFRQGPDGLPIRQVEKRAGSYDAGIYKLWDMFSTDPISGKSEIAIFESCLSPLEWRDSVPVGDIAWELERFVFKKKQKADEETLREKVAKINDHYIDCLRYIAMAGTPGANVEIKSHLDGSWD